MILHIQKEKSTTLTTPFTLTITISNFSYELETQIPLMLVSALCRADLSPHQHTFPQTRPDQTRSEPETQKAICHRQPPTSTLPANTLQTCTVAQSGNIFFFSFFFCCCCFWIKSTVPAVFFLIFCSFSFLFPFSHVYIAMCACDWVFSVSHVCEMKKKQAGTSLRESGDGLRCHKCCFWEFDWGVWYYQAVVLVFTCHACMRAVVQIIYV